MLSMVLNTDWPVPPLAYACASCAQLGSLLEGREGMLYFVFNSDVIAVMVAHNIKEGEFVAQASGWFVGLWLLPFLFGCARKLGLLVGLASGLRG